MNGDSDNRNICAYPSPTVTVAADAAYAELLETVWNCERAARKQASWTFAAAGVAK